MTHEQNIGGAAYVCELSIGDEVLSMNGMTVAILSQDQIVEAGFFQSVEWDAEVSFASDRSMSFFDPQSLLSSEISNL